MPDENKPSLIMRGLGGAQKPEVPELDLSGVEAPAAPEAPKLKVGDRIRVENLPIRAYFDTTLFSGELTLTHITEPGEATGLRSSMSSGAGAESKENERVYNFDYTNEEGNTGSASFRESLLAGAFKEVLG